MCGEKGKKSDKSIIQAVLAGNAEAYGEIVARYKNVVFGEIYSMIKNYHAAEDIAQDTFIDGYIKLKSLGEPYNVSAWLLKIAKNKCYNYFTRSAMKHEIELREFIPDTKTSTPENLLIEEHNRSTLERALKTLPELHRVVTVLYYFNDIPQNKIAEILRIPIGTVKSRLYDARLKLKKELDNMNNTEKITVDKDFEKQVAEKVKAIQNYYSLHNNSMDGFDNEFKKAVELIAKLPESKEKHAAYADVFYTASGQDEKHRDRALEEAELGEKAQIIANILFSKYISNSDEYIQKSGEAIPKIKMMPNNPDNTNALGEVQFWRGTRYFLKGREDKDLARLDEAYTDFKEAEQNLRKPKAYYANAIAGMKAVEIEKTNIDDYIGISYGICGERHCFKDGKYTFVNQPGIGRSTSQAKYDSIFFFVSSIYNSTFFDENLEIGGNIIEPKGEYTKSTGSTHTLVSKNAKVSVLSDTFDDCMHIKLHGLWFGDTYDADVYYAKDIGLVKAEFTEGDKIENYELCEYKINEGNAGSAYMPLAVGNLWRYKNTNLPPIYEQFIERELINIETTENDGIYATFSAVDYLRLKKIGDYDDDCDSDTYIMLAEKAVPYRLWHEKPKKMDFDAAIKNLKYAVQKNSSVRASLYAATAVEYVERFKQYYAKGWHIMPCCLDTRVLVKDKQEGKIICDSRNGYYIAPSQDWGDWFNERKCLARSPFRYLQYLFGIIYSDKWVVGYSEQIKHEHGEIYLKAEDGGTVTTKAGTFVNCIKVTVELEKADETDEKYYINTPQYSHCGTKIYYYAPNIGIVKYECIWGKALYASCELTEYKSYATNGEYMPVYVGNNWVYDEVTLEPEFMEKTKFDIVSGMEDEFFMICEGDVLFRGTEEEYKDFKKSLEK